MGVKTIRVVPLIVYHETRENTSMRGFPLDLKYDLNNQQIKDPCTGAHRHMQLYAWIYWPTSQRCLLMHLLIACCFL